MREGDIVAGRYRVVRRAASGGMGTVYEARDLDLGTAIALKALRVGGRGPWARAHSRLIREAQALAELEHPAVVRYVDHGVTDQGEPFLAMAWVSGGETLQDRLSARGVAPLEALRLAVRMASGLAAVHACGIVHRDLKPSNVMLPEGRIDHALLVDFGVARLASSTTELTATGDHVGTARYMAPEQIRNARSVDARADIFALGCILFECLTGHPCFGDDDAVQVIAHILFGPFPVPSVVRPQLPRMIDELIARMIDRDPMGRPTAAALEHLLHETIAAFEPIAIDLLPPAPEVPTDVPGLERRTTSWQAADDSSPPTSFELGPNAVAAAARQALALHQGGFFGRDEECQRLVALLCARTPVVLVWGGPGMGKTRLALEAVRCVAAGAASPWDALVYADLGAARDGDDIVRILAREAGVALESSATPERALARALARLGRVLVVLDPVEHVADFVAATAAVVARAAPGVQVLATSRRKWPTAGAVAIELGPLGTIATSGTPSAAALLLLERAGLLDHVRESVTPPHRPSVIDSAERVASALEGIPMAIELSAAHAQILGLDALVARVCAAGGSGGGGSLDMAAHPMRRVLDRSWDLLNEAERSALAQCAVFRGGFTVTAANAVLSVSPPAPSTVALVQTLRDHSLLRSFSVDPAREGRISMFAPVREFAWEKLQGPMLLAALRRHAAYYADIDARVPNAHSSARTELETENLLAAAEFSLTDEEGDPTAGMKALVALESTIFYRGALSGYVELLDRAVARADTEPPSSPAYFFGMSVRQTRARFDAPMGRTTRALADLTVCLHDARQRGDRAREGSVLLDLGVVHHLARSLGEARGCYEAAVGLLSSTDAPDALGRCLGNLGALSHDEGDLIQGSRFYRRAIALLEQGGETRRRANFVSNLAVLEQELGHFAEARTLFDAALTLLAPFRDARLLAITLGNYGTLKLELGAAPDAAALYERCLALLSGTTDARSRALCLARLASALALLGRTAEAEARLAHAQRMTAQIDDVAAAVVALTGGFIDLARAREAEASGRPDLAAEHLAAAQKRIHRVRAPQGIERPLVERSDDIRAAARILMPLIGSAR